MRARGTRGLRSFLVALVALSLWGASAVPATAQEGRRLEGGDGRLVGMEEVHEYEENPSLDPPFCLQVVESTLAFRGVGAYHGRGDDGQLAVYRAEIGEDEEIHEAGPLKVVVEATEEHYIAPEGTYGNRLPPPGGCDRDTYGEAGAVAATFTVHAEGHVHDGDEPCTGEGKWWREHSTFFAEWTLDADCTIEGNELGSLGAGVAPAGTTHTAEGDFEPCFNEACPDNVRANFEQNPSGQASGDANGSAAVDPQASRDGRQPVLADADGGAGQGWVQALVVFTALAVLVAWSPARPRRARRDGQGRPR